MSAELPSWSCEENGPKSSIVSQSQYLPIDVCLSLFVMSLPIDVNLLYQVVDEHAVMDNGLTQNHKHGHFVNFSLIDLLLNVEYNEHCVNFLLIFH